MRIREGARLNNKKREDFINEIMEELDLSKKTKTFDVGLLSTKALLIKAQKTREEIRKKAREFNKNNKAVNIKVKTELEFEM